MIINPYLVQPSGPAYGTLTTAWIAATGETDLTILGALNTLETDLTTYGLTSKMKALYPFVGGTAGKHKFNFMDARDLDAAFRLVFNGGWTHSSTGALPNGTNGYADSKLSPSSILTSNNHHLCFYSLTQNSSVSGINMGSLLNGNNEIWMSVYYASVLQKVYVAGNYFTEQASVNNTNTKGLHIGSQTSVNSRKLYFAGSLVATNTVNYSNTYSSNKVFIGAHNNGSAVLFMPHECAFASIGDGLTDTEAANFYTAVQAFQTTLSRQV